MKKLLVKWLEREKIFEHPIVVVRGVDDASHSSGDIDVLVERGRNNSACAQLSRFLLGKGWRVIAFRELDYLSSLVVVDSNGLEAGAVKIDFFSGLGWYGIQFRGFSSDQFFDADYEIQQAAVTLAHKITYAGVLVERDVRRVTPYIKEASELLNLEWNIVESALTAQRVSVCSKWKVRFRSSGYPTWLLPWWFITVSVLAGRARFFPIRSSGFLLSTASAPENDKALLDRLEKLYSSSGDSMQPIFRSSFLSRLGSYHAMIKSRSQVENVIARLLLSSVARVIEVIAQSYQYSLVARGNIVLSEALEGHDVSKNRNACKEKDNRRFRNKEGLEVVVQNISQLVQARINRSVESDLK